MKQYTGTKTVKAQPMRKGESYEENLLKAGVVPSEEEKAEDGYLVEYEGGYRSWSPKRVFDAAYRLSETPEDRMRIEADDLKAKLDKQNDYMRSEEFNSLDRLTKYMLLNQFEYMYMYRKCVQDRLNRMKGEPHDTDYQYKDALLSSATSCLNVWRNKDREARSYMVIADDIRAIKVCADANADSQRHLAEAIAKVMDKDEEISAAIRLAQIIYNRQHEA